MNVLKVFRELRNVSVINTIWYNFFSKHVERKNKGVLIVYKKTTLYFERGAKITIVDGRFHLGRCIGCRVGTTVRLQEDSLLEVKGTSYIEYGADILLKNGAILSLGNNSYINCRSMIRCHKHIRIGNDGFISSNIDLRDSDGHSLNGICKTEDVIIGNHVWICNNVRVLKGVTIGDGAMVGAGALVTHDISNDSLAYGIPAKIVKTNIVWD